MRLGDARGIDVMDVGVGVVEIVPVVCIGVGALEFPEKILPWSRKMLPLPTSTMISTNMPKMMRKFGSFLTGRGGWL